MASTTTPMRLPPEEGLHSARLWLRRPQMTDCDAVVAGIGEWEVVRMLSRVPYPYSRADAEAWVEHVTKRTDGAGLAITEGGRLIGVVNFTGLPVVNHFGYWLAKPAWGKGYATEAARTLLAWCFDEGGATEVQSGVFADNDASLRVQRKLGFRIVGEGQVHSLARGAAVTHIDTQLTPDRFIRQA